MIKTHVENFIMINNAWPTEMARQCPICNGYGAPQVVRKNHLQILSSEDYYVFIEYLCAACEKPFLGIYELSKKYDSLNNGYYGKLIHTIPSINLTSLPEFILKVSPRAVKLYEASEMLFNMGYEDLSGSGFRSCMEILIKDYAISEQNLDKEKVSSLKLESVIKKVLPTLQLKKSADVVRLIGNGFTHYKNEFNYDDLILLKRYLDIMIKLLESEYLITHPKYQRKDPFDEEL